jgi:hypothetical protein
MVTIDTKVLGQRKARGSIMARVWMAAALLSVGLWVSSAHGQETDRLALAREIVELSGALQTARRMVPEMRTRFIAQIRVQYGEADAERIWELFVEEFDAGLPLLIEASAQEYARALTHEELEGVRDFFKTNAGRALAENQFSLALAGQRAGAMIGATAGLRAEQRFREERGLSTNSGPT